MKETYSPVDSMDEKGATPPSTLQSEEKPDGPVIQQQPVAGTPQPAPYPSDPQPPPYASQPAAVAGVSPGAAYPPQPTVAGVAPQQAGNQPPVAGQPPPPPGYLPIAAGYPGAAAAAGSPYLAALQAGTGGALQDNLPPKEVIWMPLPSDVPTNCPPGLEYLTQIDQILVNQQIELLELVTNFETENTYRIRNTLGQQVYFAKEESTVFQRQCCGPGRAFSMSITDNSQREVIHLERPQRVYWNCSGLVCYCCCSCCLPHRIEVQSPPGTVVGYVKQDPLGILHPWFYIQNAEEETVLRMKGPALGCSCYSDANFFVLSADGTQEVGKISKQWGGLAKEYFTDADNFGIQFPMDLDVKMKAVMVGACFLIDFMFFEAPGGGHNRGRHHHHHHHRRH